MENQKIRIGFYGGESAYEAGKSCNYLIALEKPTDAEGDPVELYAEIILPDEDTPDDYGYEALKAEIIEQAKEHGIPAENLVFWDEVK